MHEFPKDGWYLREWMEHFDLKQSHLVERTGWLKGRVSFIYNGKTHYNKQIAEAVADALGLYVYELFLPPNAALAIRGLRELEARMRQGLAELEGFEKKEPLKE